MLTVDIEVVQKQGTDKEVPGDKELAVELVLCNSLVERAGEQFAEGVGRAAPGRFSFA